MMSPPPPVWNLRAVSFIPLFYISLLFFCLVVLLFLLLAHYPDLFPPKPPFSERWALLCGICFVFLFLSS